MTGASADVPSTSPVRATAVSESERARAVVRLRDRYANDGVTLDEFSRALDGVFAAGTLDELRAASPDSGLRAPLSRVPWLEAEALEQHLAPDEPILWVGRPEESVNLTRRGLLTAVPFIAFLVFWESTAASGGAPIFFLLWGVFVALMAAYQALGRRGARAGSASPRRPRRAPLTARRPGASEEAVGGSGRTPRTHRSPLTRSSGSGVPSPRSCQPITGRQAGCCPRDRGTRTSAGPGRPCG